jgi:magnesium transporter
MTTTAPLTYNKFASTFFGTSNSHKSLRGVRFIVGKSNPTPAKSCQNNEPESVRQLMRDDFITVDSTLSAGEANEKVRVLAQVVQQIYLVYVTGVNGRLDGVVLLRDLLVADPAIPVTQLMKHPSVCLTVDAAKERAQKLMQEQGVPQIPVIDADAKLIGIITPQSI